MSKATIQTVAQTEVAGLFTICFEGESYSEFQKFITKCDSDTTLQKDLQIILQAINRMLTTNGFLERNFRPEGRMKDGVCALPIETGKLRLYCLRLSNQVLIAGNGGIKDSKTYNSNPELLGYVISLQKLDELIKAAVKKGNITIEETNITGIDSTEFEL